MASLNIFGKPQKPAKEEEYDSSYYSTEEEYTAVFKKDEKGVNAFFTFMEKAGFTRV